MEKKEQIKRKSEIYRVILSLIKEGKKPTLETIRESLTNYTDTDIRLELQAWHLNEKLKQGINFVLNRNTLLVFCIFVSALSLYTSVYCLKEEQLNLFASSGAIMSVAGLFLTIKHTLIVTWLIPVDWATNILKYGSGASLSNGENKQKDYENTINIKKDEQYGICLIIIGNIVWAYSLYIPRLF